MESGKGKGMEGRRKESVYFNLLFQRHSELLPLQETIWNSYEAIRDVYCNQGKLLICGNGGSAADADHIVGELMKGFLKKRELPREKQLLFGELSLGLQGALPAIALTQHGALNTAYMNDVEPSMIFAQQVYGYGKPEDALLAISTSGNSLNVNNAVRVAKKCGMKVIGMTGKDGGLLRRLADICITVPESETAYVQEDHIAVYHTLCAMLEEFFF